MSFTPINKIIKDKMSRTALSRQITASLVCEEFDKIVCQMHGKNLAKHVKAVYLKDKILTVACLSSSAAQEIKFAENKILSILNHEFNNCVERLSFLL